MYPTTVTNEDGTFSPAIRIDRGDGYDLYVCAKSKINEDRAIGFAIANATYFKRQLLHMLTVRGYTLR